jgi:hypothetical protein
MRSEIEPYVNRYSERSEAPYSSTAIARIALLKTNIVPIHPIRGTRIALDNFSH